MNYPHDTAPALIDFMNNLRSLEMSEENLQYFQDSIKIRQVKSKETLVLAGDICKNAYLVLEGGFVCRYINEKESLEMSV